MTVGQTGSQRVTHTVTTRYRPTSALIYCYIQRPNKSRLLCHDHTGMYPVRPAQLSAGYCHPQATTTQPTFKHTSRISQTAVLTLTTENHKQLSKARARCWNCIIFYYNHSFVYFYTKNENVHKQEKVVVVVVVVHSLIVQQSQNAVDILWEIKMKMCIPLDTQWVISQTTDNRRRHTEVWTRLKPTVIHDISRHRQNLGKTTTTSDGVQCALVLSTTHTCREFQ